MRAATLLLLASCVVACAASPRETPTVQLIRQVEGAVLPIFAEPEKGRISSGTAAVIHPDGFLLSNDHVMLGKPGVAIIDRRRYNFRVIGRLPGKDIALLELRAPQTPNPIPFGRSHDLMAGEPVLAVGNPGGRGIVYTQGIISAPSIMRDVSALAVTFFKTGRDEFIQFDAASNPGNSGGPLINALGQQIGIVSAGVHHEENINYAIPIDRVRRLFNHLLPLEEIANVWSGLEVDLLADQAVITKIAVKSPAAKAGLKLGDVLTRVAGKPARTGLDWSLNLLKQKAKRHVDLVYQRNGNRHETRLEFAPYPLAPVADPDGKQPGLRFKAYEGEFKVMPDFEKLKPYKEGVAQTLATEDLAGREERFALVFEGYIEIPKDGVYRLTLGSDDGSKLFFDQRLLIDNDDNHPLQELSRVVRVKAGLHPVRIEFFDFTGEAILQLSINDRNEKPRPVPDEWFFHD